MDSKHKKKPFNSQMMVWWWLSVPYCIFFLLSIWLLELFGISGGAIGHSGMFVPFIVLAVLTSLSSGIWFLAAIYRLLRSSNVQMTIGTFMLLALSVVAGGWSVLYLAKR